MFYTQCTMAHRTSCTLFTCSQLLLRCRVWSRPWILGYWPQQPVEVCSPSEMGGNSQHHWIVGWDKKVLGCSSVNRLEELASTADICLPHSNAAVERLGVVTSKLSNSMSLQTLGSVWYIRCGLWLAMANHAMSTSWKIRCSSSLAFCCLFF